MEANYGGRDDGKVRKLNVMLDDSDSGFRIVKNVHLELRFNNHKETIDIQGQLVQNMRKVKAFFVEKSFTSIENFGFITRKVHLIFCSS